MHDFFVVGDLRMVQKSQLNNNRNPNFHVRRRGGGGIVVGKGGKYLNLQSTSALSVLGVEKVRR